MSEGRVSESDRLCDIDGLWRHFRYSEKGVIPSQATVSFAMSIAAKHDLAEYCREAASRAKAAAAELALARGEQKNAWLRRFGGGLRQSNGRVAGGERGGCGGGAEVSA